MLSFLRLKKLGRRDSFTSALGLAVMAGLSLVPAIAVWDRAAAAPWARFWVCVAIGVLGLLTLPLLVLRRRRYDPFTLAIPLICLAIWLLGAAQTLPLPSGLTWLLSRGSAAAYTDWIPAPILHEQPTHPPAPSPSPSSPPLPPANWQLPTSSPPSSPPLPTANWQLPTSSPPSPSPLSLCVYLTQQALTLPALFGITALLGMIACRGRRSLILFLGITALSGGALACLGLLDIARQNAPYPMESLFPWPNPNAAPFGPFVNKNSAAGYLNVTLACTLGLLVLVTAVGQGDRPLSVKLTRLSLMDRMRLAVDSLLHHFEAAPVGLCLLIALQIAAILATGSRGGMLAAATGLVVCFLKSRQLSTAKLLSVTVLVAVVSMLAIGVIENLEIGEKTQARIASIWTTTEGSQVGRLRHWQDSLRATFAHLPAGSGFGTYRYAYLPTQHFASGSWFLNADNMLMEWLVEGGLWLMPLVLLGAWLFVQTLGRLEKASSEKPEPSRRKRGKRPNRSPENRALVTSGWFLLASLTVSQTFDFGILMPPLYLTVALFVGIAFGSLRHDNAPRTAETASATLRPLTAPPAEPAAEKHEPAAEKAEPAAEKHLPASAARLTVPWFERCGSHPAWLLPAICLAFAVIWGVTLRHNHQAAIASYLNATLEAQPSRIHDPALARYFAIAPPHHPMFLNACATALLRDQKSLAVQVAARANAPGELPRFEATAGIPARRDHFYLTQNSQLTQEFDSPPITPATALLPGQRLDQLWAARRLAAEALRRCPLDFRSRELLIQTSFLRDDDQAWVAALVAQNAALWPGNVEILDQNARLAIVHPGFDQAAPLIARVLELQPGRYQSLWPLIRTARDVEQAVQAFPSDAESLVSIIENGRLPAELEAALIARANRILAENGEQLDGSRAAYLRGTLLKRVGDLPAATAAIADAVRLDPGKTAYRVLYADLLAATGQTAAAREQLQRCLIQTPDDPALKKKLARLNH